jgi:hypothetical protein
MKYMIETEQKLIQIGSSEGVTLSKKDIATLGAKRGDMLKIRVERVTKKTHDMKIYYKTTMCSLKRMVRH